jgi:hypothetical protein
MFLLFTSKLVFDPFSNRRKYFHPFFDSSSPCSWWLVFVSERVLDGGKNWAPNFTAIAMVLSVVSQGLALREGMKSESKMTQKPIDRLYGLPFVLIILILLVKYFDLFPIPGWVLGVVVLWGAITFFINAMKQRKKEV